MLDPPITYATQQVTVAPGTYYVTWTVLFEGTATTQDAVIALTNQSTSPETVIASSGVNTVSTTPYVGGTITGSTIYQTATTAILGLINYTGAEITLVRATGGGTQNFVSSMTIIKLV